MSICIWVDCDEVLCETIDELLKYSPFIEKNIKKEDISSYFLWDVEKINITKEEWIRIFFSFFDSEKFYDCKPVKWALNKLRSMKEKGFKLIVVTARATQFEKQTKKWVEDHFPWIFSDFLFMNQFKENEKSKSQLCKELWISYLIDDSINNLLDVNSAWIKGILLDKPWNQDIEDNELLKRVNSWDDITPELFD